MATRLIRLHASRATRVYSNASGSLTDSSGVDYKALFGPRDIYDSAHAKEKVLSVPYETVLKIAEELESGRPYDDIGATSQDLLIISKIMRRAPRLDDAPMVKQRLSLARQLCHTSAVLGNEPAGLFWAEETLRSSTSPEEERKAAMSMLTDLAKRNSGKANYILANELFSLRQEKNAMKAYRLAGEQGVPEAFTKLGRILRHQGYHKQSVAAFKLAAEAGEPNAQFMMSTFTKDENERIHYLHQAASGGKEEAAHNLGEHYRRKAQIPLAKEFLGMAADRGFQISQMNLASILRNEKKFDLAEKWYTQAIAAGGDVAKHAESLLSDMKKSPEYANRGSGTGCMIM